jgi:diguanylate cyclase (GGDEF)-like protein
MIPYNHNLAVFYRVLTSVIVTGSFIAASAINTFYISKNLDALKTLGEHDNLTKQYNRRMLFEKGNSLYYISNRYHFNFSLVLIDIDFFKQINDTYGHLTGDKVLVELTGLLRENIRESDILFRYGGEEFVIILQHVTDTDTVLKIGEALRSAIENHNFSTTSGEVFKVTASFGIVAFAENQFVNFDEMMLAGDRALYTAKKNGRNQIVLSV